MYLYLVYTLASLVIGFPILKLLRLWFLAITSAYHHRAFNKHGQLFPCIL